MKDLVVAMTGASGSIYGARLLNVLLRAGRRVHLVISPAAVLVMKQELDISADIDAFCGAALLEAGNLRNERETPAAEKLIPHHYQDFSAGIASGSFLTGGMVVCPCSMGSLACIASGHSTNLIQRAADVHLKERRTLIVVPRETPLGSIQLANMKTLADAGAVILPAMPGFYQHPESVADLVDFVVGRICDQLGVEHELSRRWGDG